MIGKIVKGVLRAAVAQPWDYMSEGAPDDWEFRLSPDEKTFAIYDPNRGEWYLIQSIQPVAVVHSLAEMDRNTEDWRQFLSVEDPDD